MSSTKKSNGVAQYFALLLAATATALSGYSVKLAVHERARSHSYEQAYEDLRSTFEAHLRTISTKADSAFTCKLKRNRDGGMLSQRVPASGWLFN